MKSKRAQTLQQIHCLLGSVGEAPPDTAADAAIYSREQDIYKSCLLRLCPAEKWCKGDYAAGCPRPILVAKHHQEQLELFHGALTAAIGDIVQRWWSDPAARFPQRMPIPKEEEELLQWIETQVPHNIPEFQHCLGSWRPDFVVGDVPQGGLYPSGEIFCLTEINARFIFNGFLHEGYGRQAFERLGVEERGFRCETSSSKIFDGLCSLFNPDRPLHLLKGKETGIDIHMFVDFVERHFGLSPRIIAPENLRLVPDNEAPLGYKLCCLAPSWSSSSSPPPSTSAVAPTPALFSYGGEIVEEIERVGLELHQDELFSLPWDVLRAVALRCFNDLRTVLLVHDKRMLGLVRDELDSLVARSVLSEAQADVLRHGIPETLLPGSSAIRELLRICADEAPDLRCEYLLKPIRGGKGAGIMFGDELSASEWIAHLQRLRNAAEPAPGRPTWVVQRLVKQRSYDVVFGSPAKSSRRPLIGTYHVVNGELLGFGTWRAGPGRICAVSNGAAWICSVVEEDDPSESGSSSEY